MGSIFFMSVLVPLSIMLPLLVAILRYRHLPETGRRVFFYLLFSGFVSAAVVFVGRYLHLNNLPLSHIYTPLDLAFITWIYMSWLKLNRFAKPIAMLLLAFSILSGFNAGYFQSIFTYSSYTRSLEAIICLLLALNFYARMAAREIPARNYPLFYFNTGFFLYFSGAFMLFIFSNFSIWNLKTSDYTIIWVVHAALVLLQYIFFTIGFCLCKK